MSKIKIGWSEEIFEFKINDLNEVVKREVINKKITGKLEITKCIYDR